jgi:hypothetical protein
MARRVAPGLDIPCGDSRVARVGPTTPKPFGVKPQTRLSDVLQES